MRARSTRTVSVTTTATSIRAADTPGTFNPDALPVTFAVLRYASGGGTIEVSDKPIAFGSGQTVEADTDFNDASQSLERYAVASAGSIDVDVTDYEN